MRGPDRKPRKRRPSVPVSERLWRWVAKGGPDECWLWTGRAQCNGGYGKLAIGGGQYLRVHRLAFELANGPIADGLIVCHKCDVPACCNPDHLFLGTKKDNMDDKMRKGRGTPPPRFYGPSHHKTKITEQQARSIIRDARPARIVANEYGLSECTIYRLRGGKTWRKLGTGEAG